MNALATSDRWDEVWAEYDARQFRLALARLPRDLVSRTASPLPRRAETTPSLRPWSHIAAAVLAGAIVLGLWLALPWLLAARLSAAIGSGDAPALMRHFDAPVAMESLRAGLAAEVPDGAGEGARAFLSGMADRMAASWQTPDGLRAWLTLRARGGVGEGSPTPLSTLRGAYPTGLAAFRLEYGPRHGDGGVAFDLAWQEGDFRVVGVRFLEPPSRPWSPAILAMR